MKHYNEFENEVMTKLMEALEKIVVENPTIAHSDIENHPKWVAVIEWYGADFSLSDLGTWTYLTLK